MKPKRKATKTARKRAPRKTSPEAEQKKLWKKELRTLQTEERAALRELLKAHRRDLKAIDKRTKEHKVSSQNRTDRIAILKGRI